MDYQKEYLFLIEKLLKRKLDKTDGIDIEEIEQVEIKLSLKFPDSMIQYYQIAGNNDVINHYHNIIYTPEEMKISNDYLVFMEENQLVCYWGIALKDLDKEDPEVYQGQVFEDTDRIDWYSEEMGFAEFIMKMLEWEFEAI